MTTLQIHFDEGPVVRLAVSAPILVSMLVLRPGLTGVSFRRDLKFVLVQAGGQRKVMSTSHICFAEDER